MKDEREEKKTRKGFFSRMLDKFDKKMEEKVKSIGCCKSKDNSSKNSCCS